MKKLLEEIINSWVSATSEAFTDHPIAKKIREEFPEIIKNYISNTYPSFEVKSSAGAGNWANVPWLSILDPEITNTTQDGIYPVYLFKADGSGIYLSLNQGTTNPAKLLGKKGAEKQAHAISTILTDSIKGLKNWGDSNIDLAANTPLGKSYESSNIVAKYYPAKTIPDDDALKKDLLDLCAFYKQVPKLWQEIKQNEGKNIVVTPKNLNNILNIPKPFILLAGISGTGKTRFVKEQAKFFSADGSNYQLVSVRPDWHEPSDLLGYISRLGNEGAKYIATDFLHFIVAAWKHIIERIDHDTIQYKSDGVPYWLCLDEMNLAPVEQYFANYLSVIETRYWDDDGVYHCSPLLNAGVFARLGAAGLKDLRVHLGLMADEHDALWAYFQAKGISIPPNLIVAGTVNMDETTHGFSRKVIDRAFTLDFGEFFPNDYHVYFSPTTRFKALTYPTISQVDVSLIADYDPEGQQSIEFLTAINTVLKDTPFELAYRALNELFIAVVCFMPKEDPTNNTALQAVWDDFLMTKVLPRIEGDSEKLHDDGESSLLTKLEGVLAAKLPAIWADYDSRPDFLREGIQAEPLTIACRSKKKLAWMKARLSSNGFTAFWP